MDVHLILQTFNAHRVDYLLIGGMNFLLFHEPVLTFDVDLWIDDVPENLRARNSAGRAGGSGRHRAGLATRG